MLGCAAAGVANMITQAGISSAQEVGFRAAAPKRVLGRDQ